MGYEIVATAIDDYELTIGMHSYNESPYMEQNILMTLPYKKTGKNLVESCMYYQYMIGSSLEGDLITGELQSNVTKNTRFCIAVTFSGKLITQNQEIIITEGKVNYQYPTPFDP